MAQTSWLDDLSSAATSTTKWALWERFCAAHAMVARSVPLFATGQDGRVETITLGQRGTPFLRRSTAMEAIVGHAAAEALAASPQVAEGLLYLMLRLDHQGRVVPLYIGRAGRHEKNGTLVSANLEGIRPTGDGTGWTNGRKFARWGYGYAYHMGDLSCAVLPGHEPRQPAPKYRRWARQLFEEVPSTTPRPRSEVRFWCAPWGPTSVGIWPEFGACPLAFIEYLLIGVASLLFPDDLLNEEGVNRRSADEQPISAYSPGEPSATAVTTTLSGDCSGSGDAPA